MSIPGSAAAVALALSLGACATPGAIFLDPGSGGSRASTSDPRAGLAPDDDQDPARHHDYVVKTAAGESLFVWIPHFTAYQLLHSSGDLPRGAWILEQPAGQEGRSWAMERFGGFYAGKFEASRAPDGTVLVQQGVAPWALAEWDDAKALSERLLPGRSHLLRGDEWTALAVWATIHGVDVRGNTRYGTDGLDPATTFARADASGVALTGSARNAGWSSKVNATAHTGGPDGVFDLVGNLREWESAVTLRGHEFFIDGAATGIGGTAPGYVASLHTRSDLRKHGIVAGTTERAVVAYFNVDAYHVSGFAAPGGGHAGMGGPSGGDPAREYRTNRGGSYIDGHSGEVAQAGMWLLCINREAGYRGADQGFRPALSF